MENRPPQFNRNPHRHQGVWSGFNVCDEKQQDKIFLVILRVSLKIDARLWEALEDVQGNKGDKERKASKGRKDSKASLGFQGVLYKGRR